MKEIILAADKLAREEIRTYGKPMELFYDFSNETGLFLAKTLGADTEIVEIGTRLMDVALGRASSQENIENHKAMGVEMTKEFLSSFDISQEVKNKIVHCVEAHHGDIPWECIEAEICANADCYRFISPIPFISFIHSLGKRGLSFEESLEFAKTKLEEKWNILSLEICKQELEPHYKAIKKMLAERRE